MSLSAFITAHGGQMPAATGTPQPNSNGPTVATNSGPLTTFLNQARTNPSSFKSPLIKPNPISAPIQTQPQLTGTQKALQTLGHIEQGASNIVKQISDKLKLTFTQPKEQQPLSPLPQQQQQQKTPGTTQPAMTGPIRLDPGQKALNPMQLSQIDNKNITPSATLSKKATNPNIIDNTITKIQDFLAQPDHQAITNALATSQHVVEPAVQNPVVAPIWKGYVEQHLGSSRLVAETLNKGISTSDNPLIKGYNSVGELVGGTLAFLAGGEVVKGLQLGKAALPVLFATLGQTSAGPDTTVMERLEKLPVDTIAGFLFGKIPEVKKMVSVDALKQLGAVAGITGGQGLVDSVIQGLPPEQAAKEGAKMAVIAGLFHVTGHAIGLLSPPGIESHFTPGEHTPQEVIDTVMKSGLESSTEGKAVLQAATEAQAKGMNLNVEHPIKVSQDSQELVEKAKTYDPEFKAKVDAIAQETGVEATHGNVKTPERVQQKIIKEYGGDVSKLQDVNRSALLVKDPKSNPEIIKSIEKQFGKAVRIKPPDGEYFQKTIVNVKTPHGVAEIQLASPEMWHAKTKGGGDELYHQIRSDKNPTTEEYKQNVEKMKKLYDDARASEAARLNASSVEGEPSNSATYGGNGRPEAVTADTTLPSSETLTSVPSTSKNLGNVINEKPPSNSSIPENTDNSNQETKTASATRTNLPVGEGETKTSKLEARMKQTLDDMSPAKQEELGLSTYQQMNKADQIKQATEYVQNNREQAMKVLTGEIEPPKGLIPESIYIAMTKAAEGDMTLATKLASLKATALGQRLSILTELDPHSPVKILNDVYKIKEEAFAKRNKGKTAGQVKKDLLTQAQAEVEKKVTPIVKKADKYSWDNFINSIQC